MGARHCGFHLNGCFGYFDIFVNIFELFWARIKLFGKAWSFFFGGGVLLLRLLERE